MLTRRDFVLGGAGLGLGGLVGCGAEPGRAPRSDHGPYDLCVVGSGFAGLSLALRTSAAGLDTVIVEAGGAFGEDPGEAFAFASAGRTAYPLGRSRVIAVGGTSNHWTGSVNRLRPTDFRMRSEFGMYADWPLDYDALEPYYCQAELALAVTGNAPVSGAEPPRTCAYPFRLHEGYEMPDVTFERRPVPLFAVPRSRREGHGDAVRLPQREIPRFLESPHAALLDQRVAVELVTTDGRRVEHLAVRAPDGSRERVHARRFVVAAGVVESPALLLRSTSRWFPDGLGNRRGLLGRYFVAHPSYIWTIRAPDQSRLTPGIHRTYAFNEVFRKRDLNACHYQLHVDESEFVSWKAQPEMEPRPENRVALSAARRDPFGLPLVELHFTPSPRDQRTAAAAVPFLRRQVRAVGAGPAAVENGMRWRYHPSGTCRMAADDAGGVVDPTGRVFGVENLYVSGATVFPTGGTSNPTLSVVALALRLADHVIAAPG